MEFALTRHHGQAVKTPPSHGGNRGSIPRGGANKLRDSKNAISFLLLSPRDSRTPRGSDLLAQDGYPFVALRHFPY